MRRSRKPRDKFSQRPNAFCRIGDRRRFFPFGGLTRSRGGGLRTSAVGPFGALRHCGRNERRKKQNDRQRSHKTRLAKNRVFQDSITKKLPFHRMRPILAL